MSKKQLHPNEIDFLSPHSSLIDPFSAGFSIPKKAFPNKPSGSGGDGAVVIAARRGVFFSGKIDLGYAGFGAIYGRFRNTGRFSRATPAVRAYGAWISMHADEVFLTGGAGGGGAGGDGQLLGHDLFDDPFFAVSPR